MDRLNLKAFSLLFLLPVLPILPVSWGQQPKKKGNSLNSQIKAMNFEFRSKLNTGKYCSKKFLFCDSTTRKTGWKKGQRFLNPFRLTTSASPGPTAIRQNRKKKRTLYPFFFELRFLCEHKDGNQEGNDDKIEKLSTH